jgi:Glucodextranase, domain B
VQLHRTTLRLIGATIGLLMGLFVASPALAAYDFTQSQITSPGDPYVILDKAGDSNNVDVSGTTNATSAGLNVNVRCYFTQNYGGSDYYTLGSTTTNADGSFAHTFSISNLSDNEQACRLRAVPDSPPYDVGSFRGPRAQVTYWDPQNSTAQVHGGDGTYFPYDYFVDAPGFRGSVEFYSAGSEGIYYFSPGVSNREPSGPPNASYAYYYGWEYGDGLYSGDYNNTGSAIRVDNQNAYNASGTPMHDYDGAGPEGSRKPAGWQPLSSDVQVATNGDVKITEVDTFWLCDDPSVFPATVASCANVHDSGVHFTRVYMRTNDATRVDVTDTLASADGHAHSVFLQYYNEADAYEYPSFHFDGEAANSWSVVGDDTQLDKPATPGGIAWRDSEYPDDQYDTPNGSLVWLTQPSRIWFNDDGYYPIVEHNVSVPAGGAATVQHVFQVANLSSIALDQMNGVLDKQGSPVVAFTSPANGTATNSDHATLTGTATDNKGVTSLKINGTSVALASDGTFSFPATLVAGANTFNAVATDAQGNTGTAKLSLTYVKLDPLAPLCKVPSVKKKSKLSAAQKKLRAANCTPKTHKMFSSKVKKGRVISLGAKAHQVFTPKATITINVSKGKKK